jgi:prepilin-type N-terminal cleavage/methylation domain-containing protein
MRKSGFTLVEIMIVVAIIGLLAAIAIPNFIRARTTTQTNSCLNNLRQFDSAMQQYALENSLSTGNTFASTALNPYLTNLTVTSVCPGNGTYGALDTVGTQPTCTVHRP